MFLYTVIPPCGGCMPQSLVRHMSMEYMSGVNEQTDNGSRWAASVSSVGAGRCHCEASLCHA